VDDLLSKVIAEKKGTTSLIRQSVLKVDPRLERNESFEIVTQLSKARLLFPLEVEVFLNLASDLGLNRHLLRKVFHIRRLSEVVLKSLVDCTIAFRVIQI